MGVMNGHGFDIVVAPTVTSGAYSGGDIVGGVLTFPVGDGINSVVVVTGVTVAVKAAVTSALKLVLFNANPTGTTTTDNAAYSLAVADVLKVVGVIDFTASSALLTDHGTPNTYSVTNVNITCMTERGTTAIYGLLIDGTGWTLTSTADIQVRLVGVGA